jgi:hypothetical protein
MKDTLKAIVLRLLNNQIPQAVSGGITKDESRSVTNYGSVIPRFKSETTF